MKHLFKSALIVSLCLMPAALAAQKITSTLKGTVVDRDSDTIILIKDTEDLRMGGAKIPIENNSFEYELEVEHMKKFELIFQDEIQRGGWRPVHFFPDSSITEFTLHPAGEFEKNIISGGPLNDKMAEFNDEKSEIFNPEYRRVSEILDSLESEGEKYTDKYFQLLEMAREAESREEQSKLFGRVNEMVQTAEAFRPEAAKYYMLYDSINQAAVNWELGYIKDRDDIFYYSQLFEFFKYSQYHEYLDPVIVDEIFQKYQLGYPDHPYTEEIANRLKGMKIALPGNEYIDFSAQTIEGETLSVSELIEGEVTLLDFWASWCSPCRTRSKSIIPLYQQYNEKGFDVIGVAREFNNTDAFEIAMETDGYPWISLIDLDDKHNVWSKYNITGSGAMFLVDSEGVILAVNPDAEEVEKILSERLR